MSTAPQTLKDLRWFLAAELGVAGSNFGIRGSVSPRRPWGYHLGRDDIYGPSGMGDRDYSVRHRRDRAGLTNASAGFDIRLPRRRLIALCAYLVEMARTGADGRMLVEVLGPNATGEARRWARSNDWRPVDARDDHEWHIHVSFRRDTEFVDKRPLFHDFVDYQPPAEESDPLEPEPGDAPPTDNPEMPTDVEPDTEPSDADRLAEIHAISAPKISTEE